MLPFGTLGRFATKHVPVCAPIGDLLVFVIFFRHRGHWIFGRGSNIRYTHFIELFFSFLMVFTLSQLDIY